MPTLKILPILFLLTILCTAPAGAATLNSVQSGTTTITGGSKTVTITSVDTSKAFLVFGVNVTEQEPSKAQISGQITNATTLTFERVLSGNTVTITWQVVEFTSGVSVQRGAADISGTGFPANATLTAVNTAKSFPILSHRTDGPDFDSDDFWKAKITTPTNLEMNSNNDPDVGFIEWQVVEYSDASVQQGDLSFASGDASKTDTLTSVDTSKSWLIYSYMTQTGTISDIGQKLIRGRLTNSTTLTFDRNNTGVAADLSWYLVEFTDLTTTQHNSQSFSTSETQKNVTITSVETAESIAAGGYYARGGRSNYSVEDNPGVGWFTLDLTSSTNLQIDRELTGSATADLGWFVVEFNQAGFTVTESGGSTSVAESATTDTFTVVLDEKPNSNVVFNVSSGDTGEATVNVSSLTFTTANWSTAQTVTVTGVDDDIIDGNQNTTLTISVDDANSDDYFDPLSDQTVSATTTDDDVAGFTIVESGGSTSVAESGTTDTFTAVLDAEPDTNVVITVTSADTGEATVNVSSLTFTPANWDTAQTVTVTGVDDIIFDGNKVTTITLSVDDANSDDNFDPLADQTVNATTTDDEVAGFTVVESSGYTSVDESGTTDTFTVVLDGEPLSNVVITVTSGDTGEATVNQSSLTFTPANWDTAQTVTVTGVDDALQDGHQNFNVTLSIDDANSDDAFDPVADQQVSVLTTDDDLGPVQLNSVQSGTTTMTGNSQTAAITSVDTSKAFLVFGVNVNENEPQKGQINGEITNATTLTFQRNVTGNTVTITWHVVEFSSGVSVQRGSTGLSPVPVNVTLTAVNTAKSFPIISHSCDGTTFDDNDFYKAKITTPTNLEIDSYYLCSTGSGKWQVVEYTDSAVQQGDVSFGSGDSSKTDTVTSVDTSKSWLIYTYKAEAGTAADIGQKLIRGRLTNSTTLTFDRNNTGDIADLSWYLVEFSDLTTTQHGSQSFTTSETQKNVTISSVETAEAIAAGGHYARGGRSSYNGDDNPGVGWFTLDLTSSTNLQIDREITGSATADLGWFVVEFNQAGYTVTESGGSTSVAESGTTDTFTVVLDEKPNSNVVFNVSSGDTGEATVNVSSLTFTTANWSTAQTVTVTGVDDDIDDGNQNTTLTISVDDANSDDYFDPLSDQTVSATTTDDDVAGFTIVESGGTSVNESGTTDTFTAVLDAEPLSNVVILVSSADTGEATVNVASLTFTPANWDTAQTVTVTGVDDDLDDGDQSTLITLSIDDANSDDTFDPLADQTVNATTVDDDASGFTIVESGGTSVNESGTTDTFTAVLDAEPVSNVVILVNSADTGEATVNVASLTFTPANWDTAQTVTVTGVDDDLDDGDQSTLITLSIDDANSDDTFDPLADQTVNATTVDDDASGFTIVESGGTSVNESGTTDTFTAVLDAEPTSNVVILVSSADTGEATVNVASMTFTPANWDTAQTVTVTGVDDDLDDGDQNTLITLSIDDANSDDTFDPLADQTVNATTVDDDASGFTIVESGGTSVNESGTTDTFTAVLDAEPVSNVVILVSSADTGEATVNVASLTFTPANWDTAQTVTVTGVDDDLDDGDQSTLITLSIDDANSDDTFDPLADQTVSATTVDDDASGFTIVESSGSTSVNESGTTDTFTVVLDAEPTSNVVITTTSGDTGEATVNVFSLTFTPANWDTAQTVTVTGVDDDLDDGDQNTLITMSIDDANSDDTFDPLPDQTVNATTVDDDASGFTIVESGGTSVNESGTTDTFTVVLDAEPTSNVVITTTSADTGEATVNVSSLTFTPANWDTAQTVTVTGVDDDLDDGDQNTLITMSVDDANSDDTFDPLPNQTVRQRK